MNSFPDDRSTITLDQPTPTTEIERPYMVRMTPTVYARLVQYHNREENASLRQSQVIEKLLTDSEYPNIGNRHQPAADMADQRHNVFADPTSEFTSAGGGSLGNGDAADVDDLEYEEMYDDADDQSMMVQRSVVIGPALQTYDQPAADGSRSESLPADQSISSRRKHYHPDRKGIGTGKQKPWTSGLRRYLYDIITKWQKDGLLHCRECDRWMRVVHKKCGLRCGNALDHVCSHVGEPTYACRLCSHKTVTSMQMRTHLKRVHDRVNDFDDLTDTFYSELAERISSCFDYTGCGEPPAVRRLLTCKRKPGETAVGKAFLNHEMDVSSSSVRRFVYDLVAKWKRENAVYCRHCNHWVRVGTDTSWAQAHAALEHVCGHYGKPLYVCLLCNDRTILYNQMIRHTRHVHQTKVRGNCVEEIEEYQLDLKDMAAKCFDWEAGTSPPLITADGPFLKKRRLRSVEKQPQQRKTEGSTRPEILEYGRSLIRQFCGNLRRLRCQQCEVMSIVKTSRGEPRPEILLDHALRHVGRDAYACPYCGKTAARKENMRLHLVKHKEAKVTDYVDKTGEMKEEILDMMKRCYDQNLGTQTSEESISA